MSRPTGNRYGGWYPTNPEVHRTFIEKHVALAQRALASRDAPDYLPGVQAFQNAIEKDGVMKGLFTKIFLQAAKENQITSFDLLLAIIDKTLRSAPPYYVDPGSGAGEPIGVPLLLFFDLLANTSAGYDLFRLPQFNAAMKDLLNSWGKYLTDLSGDSNAVLNTGKEGWFGDAAIKKFQLFLDPLDFASTYVLPDPTAENKGFKTWDAFFTRELKEGARPIDFKEKTYLVHSACESTVYNAAKNVNLHDQFWLKEQKYSVYDMLNGDEAMAEQFDGGTVYQAFLSPLDYHQWHAPVNGTIKKFEIIDGSYYAVLPDAGAPPNDPPFPPGSPYGALVRSQGFLNVVATRALIYIQADNPDIGLMCFIAVGMCEVSTCEFNQKVKDYGHVNVGDKLGMFHFGGSSHTLIFGPKCDVTFVDDIEEALKKHEEHHVWINSVIANVEAKKI